jgi:hypothetical protein
MMLQMVNNTDNYGLHLFVLYFIQFSQGCQAISLPFFSVFTDVKIALLTVGCMTGSAVKGASNC